MGKEEQNVFKIIKTELCVNPMVQPYRWAEEATVTIDASDKEVGGVLS